MSRFLNKGLSNLEKYIPGEQPKDKDYIKLNANESPFPVSPKVLKALNSFEISKLNYYEDPDAKDLTKAIADYYKILPEQVLVGNGSDEVLAFCFEAFCDKEHDVCMPDITYFYYSVFTKSFNINATTIPVKDDFSIDIKEYFNCGKTVLIANPNAPTGLYLSIDNIEEILKHNKDNVVIIDEAYVDFAGKSCIGLSEKYDNLVVVQTMSKSRSLAAVRVGMAIGSKDLIDDLNAIKYAFNPYNISGLSLIAATESMKDTEYFNECTSKIIQIREEYKKKFIDMGFEVLDSKTNFLFVSTDKICAKDLYSKLKENGILTRHFDIPRIDNYLRIAVSNKENMEILLEKTKSILNNEIKTENMI